MLLTTNRLPLRFVLAFVALVLVSAEGTDKSPIKTTAVPLTKDTFDEFLETHPFAFVDFDTPWCVWCQRLAPTWEMFAQQVEKEGLPIGVAKVDCTDQAELCRQQKIMAFPTMRWFQSGQAVQPDYKMDRTVDALMGYAKRKLELLKMGNSEPKHSESEDSESNDPESGDEEDTENEEDEDENNAKDEDEDEDFLAVPLSDEAFDEEEVSDDAMRFPSHKSKPGVSEMCREAGIPYGSSIQRFSQIGTNEFDEFENLNIKIAPACQSASGNARGTYSSFFRPCEFQFHVASQTKRVGSGSSFRLSTDCSKDNIYKEDGNDTGATSSEPLMDYVRGWQDECVGDYSRCYSVSNQAQAKIFMRHFCLRNWEIPDRVTHISVSCKDDKIQAVKKQEEKKGTGSGNDIGRSHLAMLAEHHREKVTILLLIVALSCCGCWVAICLGYNFVIVPYLKAIKRSKSDPDLQSLVGAAEKTTSPLD